MEKSTRYRLVMVTAPVAVAEPLAAALVEEGLAACVNIVSSVLSIYRWRGRTEREGEALLLAKSDEGHLAALARRVRDLHPYDVPEVIALPITEGSPDYLSWLAEGLRPGTD